MEARKIIYNVLSKKLVFHLDWNLQVTIFREKPLFAFGLLLSWLFKTNLIFKASAMKGNGPK